jgi:hypothetical protein
VLRKCFLVSNIVEEIRFYYSYQDLKSLREKKVYPNLCCTSGFLVSNIVEEIRFYYTVIKIWEAWEKRRYTPTCVAQVVFWCQILYIVYYSYQDLRSVRGKKLYTCITCFVLHYVLGCDFLYIHSVVWSDMCNQPIKHVLNLIYIGFVNCVEDKQRIISDFIIARVVINSTTYFAVIHFSCWALKFGMAGYTLRLPSQAHKHTTSWSFVKCKHK